MSTTNGTTSATIEEGKIFIVNKDLIPIYRYSNLWLQNGRVVPDGTNWVKALTMSGDVAVHSSEVDYTTIKAKDVHGNLIHCITNEYNYISTEDSRGRRVYFLDEQSAIANDYKFSFRLGRFADEKENNFYGDDKLLSYHTQASRIDRKRLLSYVSDDDDYLLGLEVEKCDSRLQQDGDAWKILHETGWSKESDSSLNSGGYELVSPILPLFNTNVIERASLSVRKWIDGKSDDSCGGHITLSKRNIKAEDLLDSLKHIVPIIYSLYPNRLSNRFCRAKSWNKYFEYPEKYSAFYLKDGTTEIGGRLEIRLFGRVLNYNTMLWRINLLQLLIKDGANLNQLAQKIGCPESILYKHFKKSYSHQRIGDKLRDMDKYSKQFGTHRNGISPSVKKRINNTMGYNVFPEVA